ncbi:glycosyltransferase [Sporolactobacillus nakayamae]|uniref:Cellulose synthase (UDP-forming) n=1 Tax=Sporolactobacillus nakayamae TaxID=269670 RepID=A0A1I2NTG8_9BACL|nr:glycosyltransferase [Sporolactobacillus nakayamae]SFG06873.1 cellulose synthase (UDP-forming) [Sporolactobacillus nakayamae]
MPQLNTDLEKIQVTNRSTSGETIIRTGLNSLRNKVLFLGTFISTIVYMVWRIFFTVPLEYGYTALCIGIILLIVEMAGMLEAAEHFYSMSNIVHPKKPTPPKKWYPDVDVFIPTYNEPIELLRKTVNGCCRMDYPDKSKVHIYICDDGNRQAMKILADKMGVGYLTREEHEGAKAGNLNNALEKTFSPLIATFDADMIPMHDFLMSSVPFFYYRDDKKCNDHENNDWRRIGFIQTPQAFYNPDLFQHNLFSEDRIPDEQDYFYRDVQISRNKTNSVIFGGTNAVISREALFSVGGFCTEVITEDFATGMLIQNEGFICYAIDDPHAIGQAPYDLKSLIKQRIRWARGCIQTGRKLNFLFLDGLSLKQRFSYLSSILYWFNPIKRFVYIMSPILFTVFGIIVVRCTLIEVLLFWLPMYLFQNATLRFLSKGIRNTRWTSVYDTILFPSLFLHVIFEAIGVNKKSFAVTRKDGTQNGRLYGFLHAISHVVLAILSIVGIIFSIEKSLSSGSFTFIVLLFWLVTNLYALLMAIFFMMGRPMVRKAERFRANIDCSLSWDGKIVNYKTFDISENGLSLLLDYPDYIPDRPGIHIHLCSELYQCTCVGELVNVMQFGDNWKYAFTITRIDDSEKDNLYSLVYDRQPSLPIKLGNSISFFDDLTINLFRRMKQPMGYNRKLARVPLDKTLNSEQSGPVVINDFNYEYMLVSSRHQLNNHQTLTLHVSDNCKIKAVLKRQYIIKRTKDKSKSRRRNPFVYLFLVTNVEDIVGSKEFKEEMMAWIQEARAKKMEQIREEERRSKDTQHADEFYERNYLS